MREKPNYTIGSIEKACDLLLAFRESSGELGVTELSRLLGMSKSTTHKILLTLEYKGFLEQNPSNEKYSLSAQFYSIACCYMNKLNFLTTIRPRMECLLEKFNETIHFGVYSNAEMIIVEKIESTKSIKVTSQVGKRTPLYCTSIGKAIMANLPLQEAEALLERVPLVRYTPHTITDKDALRAELAEIRRLGYATDDEEFEAGVKCVAVPIKNMLGKLVGALSITGPDFRMTDEKLEQMKQALLTACDNG